MDPFDIKPFDKEEKELIEQYENEETIPVENQELAKKEAIEMAENTLFLLKNKNINIRISGQDVSKIKAKAAEAGLPYQTLIGSILHRFVTDELIDKKEAKKLIK